MPDEFQIFLVTLGHLSWDMLAVLVVGGHSEAFRVIVRRGAAPAGFPVEVSRMDWTRLPQGAWRQPGDVWAPCASGTWKPAQLRGRLVLSAEGGLTDTCAGDLVLTIKHFGDERDKRLLDAIGRGIVAALQQRGGDAGPSTKQN